jgi:hypothetical protein
MHNICFRAAGADRDSLKSARVCDSRLVRRNATEEDVVQSAGDRKTKNSCPFSQSSASIAARGRLRLFGQDIYSGTEISLGKLNAVIPEWTNNAHSGRWHSLSLAVIAPICRGHFSMQNWPNAMNNVLQFFSETDAFQCDL